MKSSGWIATAACLAAVACSAQVTPRAEDGGAAGDSGAAGDAGDAGLSRSCPQPAQIFAGVACMVDPTVTCSGPYAAPACAACEFMPTACMCTAGAWACLDSDTQQCNAQRCPKDSGVDAHDARAEAGDAADQ